MRVLIIIIINRKCIYYLYTRETKIGKRIYLYPNTLQRVQRSPAITITCTRCALRVYTTHAYGRKRCQKRRRFEITLCPLFLEADVRVHDVYFMIAMNATGSVRWLHNVILIFSQRTWAKLNVLTANGKRVSATLK